MQEEQLQVRIHGTPEQSTLVYLPGLHGDWTLIGPFRRALANRVRFIEFTYPRTLVWSLEQYAEAVSKCLADNGVGNYWLLGESFGSQVAWPLAVRDAEKVEGLILAGGFGKHPYGHFISFLARLLGNIPLWLITKCLFGYCRLLRLRSLKNSETQKALNEFLARRTELDRRAAMHRLRLVAKNDPQNIAACLKKPIYALWGIYDPVVPWFLVKKWIQKNCPTLAGSKVVRRSDHNVLSTTSEAAAEVITGWMHHRPVKHDAVAV